jgi:hypothetical protein
MFLLHLDFLLLHGQHFGLELLCLLLLLYSFDEIVHNYSDWKAESRAPNSISELHGKRLQKYGIYIWHTFFSFL